MRNIRRFLGAIITLVFCVAMGSAAAQNVKYFELLVPTASQSIAVTTTSITLQFKNLETGNSTFNSIGIKASSLTNAGLTINSASASPGGPGTPLVTGDGYFYLTGLAPVKKGQTLTVTLNVAVTGSGCVAGEIKWHGRAFTGAPSSPSTEFQQFTSPDPKTTVTSSCNYKISGASSIDRGTSKELSVTIENVTGSAASITASMLTLTPPNGLAIVSGPTGANVAAGSSGVFKVVAKATCNSTDAGGNWGSQVTGFVNSGATSASTSINGACGLTFTGPGSLVDDVASSFTATATDGGGNKLDTFTGNFVVSSACTIDGASSFLATLGTATFDVKLDVTPTSTCSVKASANIDGKDVSSSSLSLKVFGAGELFCDDTIQAKTGKGSGSYVNDDTQTGYSKGARGLYNKDGSDCVKVNYTFTNDVLANNTVTLEWDTGAQPGAAFEYTVTWKSEFVNASGLPSRKTQVQWGTMAAPVDARACVDSALPEPYGTVVSLTDNADGTWTIGYTPEASPPPTPVGAFPITIATERLLVVDASSAGSWIAKRQQGVTPATAAVGKKVMTNPLPLDDAATPKQMQMCIVQETWFTVSPGQADCTVAGSPPYAALPACVRVRTTIFDIGDGLIIRGGS